MVDVGPNDAEAQEVSSWKVRARKVLKVPGRGRRTRARRADGGPPPVDPQQAAPDAGQAADQNARKIRELVAKWEGIADKLKAQPLEKRRGTLERALSAADADIRRLGTEPGMTPPDVEDARKQIFALLNSANVPSENTWAKQIADVAKGDTRELREQANARLIAKMMQVRNRIMLDQGLTNDERQQEVARLDRLMDQSRAARDPAPERQTFPSEDSWLKAVAQVEKLPRENRAQGADRVKSKIATVRARILNARTDALPYTEELALLGRVEDRLQNALNPDPRFVEPVAQDPAVARAMRTLEGYFRDIGANAPALTDDHRRRLDRLKQNAADGVDNRILERIAMMSVEMRGIAKAALIERQNARKAAENAQIHSVMGGNAELLEKSTFVAGSADLIQQRNKELNIGRRFRPVLNAMRDCENLDDPAKLDNMINAARDYVSRYENDLSDRDKAKPAMKEKYEIAKHAMSQAKLRKIAIDYRELGAPDQWQAASAGKAAELQAKFFFEEGRAMSNEGGSGFGAIPLKQPPAEGAVADENEPQNMNESWWVKRRAAVQKVKPVEGSEGVGVEQAEDDHLFIFKPKELEGSAIDGLDAGTGAAREVFANDLSNLLMAQGGLDVGVCKTTLARIDGDLIQNNDQSDISPGADRLGSMQQLASTGKFLSTLKGEDPNFALRIDKENFDQIVVFDMIIGNFDRHSRNALVEDPGDGGPVKMVPIDHGTSMADAATVEANAGRLIGAQNALLRGGFPQADEPLAPEILRQLQTMDPAAISQGMREASSSLLDAHAENGLTANEVLNEDQIKRMEKTIRFIQNAGETGSVKALFRAVANHAVEITNTPDDQMAQKAAQIMPPIQQAIDDAELLTPYFDIQAADLEKLMHDAEFKKIQNWLFANGWFLNKSADEIGDMMRDEPRKIARILARGEQNTAAIDARELALQEAGGEDAADLSALAKIEDQFKELSQKRSQRFREEGTNTDDNDLQNQINQLGGPELHDEICNVLPRESRVAERAESPKERNAEIYRALKEFDLLRQHFGAQASRADILNRLQEKGGKDQLVGSLIDIFRIEDAQAAAQDQQDDFGNGGFERSLDISCQNLMQEYQRLENGFNDDANKQAAQALRNEAETLYQQGLVAEAQKLLLVNQTALLMKKQTEISLARKKHSAGRELVDTLRGRIDPTSQNAARWHQVLTNMANRLDQALAEENYDNLLAADARAALENEFNADFP